MTLVRQHLMFGALCMVAPSAMVAFGLMYVSHETFAVASSVIGLLAAATIFFWSLFSSRRYRIRAVIGIIVCLVVFWLLLIIPGYVKAKRHGLAMWSTYLSFLSRPGMQEWELRLSCDKKFR